MKDLEQSGEKAPEGRCIISPRIRRGHVVVDVWESQQKLERFAGVLMPSRQNGVQPRPPQIHRLLNEVGS